MASVTQLGYIGISASNIEEWEHFGTEVLGLQSNGVDSDGVLTMRMDEYTHRFIVSPTGKDDVEFVGFQVTDQASLAEMAVQLREAGIEVSVGTPEEAKERKVEGLIKFEDPDGTPTEVYYGPPVSFDNPFNSPRPISGFVTGEQGLGHVVYHVEDLDRAVAFYRDVLGMRISDYIRNLVFFHCNPRHHTLAIIEAKGRATKKLNHFMLQTGGMNDVGSTYDLVLDSEINVTRGLGRHTNDHMTSFYMKTPSGFDVEYGWGARTVDDSTWQVQRHEKGSIWGHRPVAQPAATS
jgi:biphenyl-2,3-diol 1,2-dioxygenase